MRRSVVVQQHPEQKRRRLLALGLSLLAVFVFGLVVGGTASQLRYMEEAMENRELLEQLSAQARQLEELMQWRTNNETRREIDAAALEMVRRELAAQQETIAELERGIRFYKSLMAPGELAEGLSIRGVDVSPVEENGRYPFRILVQQSARKHELLTGLLRVTLVGSNEEDIVEHDLAALSEQVPGTDIRLRFKYFQAIDGELALPQGFAPEVVRVSATSTKPRRSEISEEFPWPVQEKLSHVGQ